MPEHLQNAVSVLRVTGKGVRTMSEADIVRAIQRYLRTLDRCFFWKVHGGMYGTAGIPDIICCYRGRFYGF